MGCCESKTDAVLDAGDVRLEEARTAPAAELEHVEREGTIRLRQAQEAAAVAESEAEAAVLFKAYQLV